MTPPAQPHYLLIREEDLVNYRRGTITFEDIEFFARSHTIEGYTRSHPAPSPDALTDLESVIRKSCEFAKRQIIERVDRDAKDYYNIRISTFEWVFEKIAEIRQQQEHP